MTINFKDPHVQPKVNQALLVLGQMATFIGRNYLERLRDVDTRFATNECKAVVNKSHQTAREVIGKLSNSYPNLEAGLNIATAAYLNSLVMNLAERLEVELPPRESVQFGVRMSETLMQKLDKTFPTGISQEVQALLIEFDKQFGTKTQQVRELLQAVDLFMETMRTLTQATEFSGYEAFLSEKMAVDGWFTNGEPNNLLVLDLADLRSRDDLDGIYSREDACFTQAVLKGAKAGAEFTVLVQKA